MKQQRKERKKNSLLQCKYATAPPPSDQMHALGTALLACSALGTRSPAANHGWHGMPRASDSVPVRRVRVGRSSVAAHIKRRGRRDGRGAPAAELVTVPLLPHRRCMQGSTAPPRRRAVTMPCFLCSDSPWIRCGIQRGPDSPARDRFLFNRGLLEFLQKWLLQILLILLTFVNACLCCYKRSLDSVLIREHICMPAFRLRGCSCKRVVYSLLQSLSFSLEA